MVPKSHVFQEPTKINDETDEMMLDKLTSSGKVHHLAGLYQRKQKFEKILSLVNLQQTIIHHEIQTLFLNQLFNMKVTYLCKFSSSKHNVILNSSLMRLFKM